jgi:hypothetical protein
MGGFLAGLPGGFTRHRGPNALSVARTPARARVSRASYVGARVPLVEQPTSADTGAGAGIPTTDLLARS